MAIEIGVSLWGDGALDSWEELLQQLGLPAPLKLPGAVEGLPLPDGAIEARVEVFLSGELEEPADEVGVHVHITADVDMTEPPTLFDVLSLDPHVRLGVDVRSDVSKLLRWASPDSGSAPSLEASMSVAGRVRLGFLDWLNDPSVIPLIVRSGDADGYVDFTATPSARVNGSDGDVSLGLELTVGDAQRDETVLELGFLLPGLSDAEPIVSADLRRATLELGGSVTRGDLGFSLQCTVGLDGALSLTLPESRPELAAFKRQLGLLFSETRIPMKGQLAFELTRTGDTTEVGLHLTIDEPRVTVDPFALLANLTEGRAEPSSSRPLPVIPMGVAIHFGLKGLSVTFSPGDLSRFAFELSVGLGAGELTFPDCYIGLLNGAGGLELQLGVKELPLPLVVPQFPLTPEDITESDGLYNVSPNGPADTAIALATARILRELDALKGEDEAAQSARLLAKLALMAAIFTVRGQLRRDDQQADWNNTAFKEFLLTIARSAQAQLVATDEEGYLRFKVEGQSVSIARNLHFVIAGLKIRIPFTRPRELAIEGSAHFDGFLAPYDVLNHLQLSAGISASMIYFRLDGAGVVVPLPGPTPALSGGSLTIGEFRAGICYTSRGFAFALAGELVLPKGLVDAVDTSGTVGVGVRPPVRTALNLRMDLSTFVLTAGAVDAIIFIPSFAAELDLRDVHTPGIADTRVVTPYWDGAQLIVKDALHLDIKQAAFLPMGGALPAPTLKLGFDIDVGTKDFGFTVVVDEFSFLIAYPIPSPFDIIDPFFNNIGLNVRFAGFGLNFTAQRPLPGFSPFAMFELAALATDPMYPIDPNGELANSLVASIKDVYITIPPAVRRLFPGMPEGLYEPLSITINLATYIGLMQQVHRLLHPVLEAVLVLFREEVAGRPEFAELRRLLDQALGRRPVLRPPRGPVRPSPLGSLERRAAPVFRRPRPASAPEQVPFEQVLLTGLAQALGQVLRTFTDTASLAPGRVKREIERTLVRLLDIEGNELVRGLTSLVRDAAPRALSYLPRQLRKLQVGADFGGFSASAALLLIGLAEAREELRRKLAPGAPRPTGAGAVSNAAEMLERMMQLSLPPGRFPNLYEPSAPESNLFAGEDLSWFDEATLTELEGLLPESGRASAVMLFAEVEVLTAYRVKFVGYVTTDGDFGLLSAADVEKLELKVSGITLPLPLTIGGRLMLAGRVQRGGVTAEVTAQAYSEVDWPLFDGASFALGSEEHPTSLSIGGNGRFQVGGSVRATLLGATLEGTFDVRDTGASITDAVLTYLAPAALELKLSGEALLQAGGAVQLDGLCDLKLFAPRELWSRAAGEQLFSLVGLRASLRAHPPVKDVTVGELRVSLALDQLELEAFPFRRTPSFKLEHVSGEVHVRVGKPFPDVTLSGRARLVLWKSGNDEDTISGQGGIRLQGEDGKLSAFVEGDLSWNGQEWSNARVEFDEQGLTVSGRTSVTLDEQHPLLRASWLPGPVFRLDLEGTLSMNATGQLEGCALRGAWLLGLKPGDWGQVLPLAMGKVELTKEDLRRGSELLNQALRFLPTELELPDLHHLSVEKTGERDIPLPLIKIQTVNLNLNGTFDVYGGGILSSLLKKAVGEIIGKVDVGLGGEKSFDIYGPATPEQVLSGQSLKLKVPVYGLKWNGEPLTEESVLEIVLPRLENNVRVAVSWNAARGCLELGAGEQASDDGALEDAIQGAMDDFVATTDADSAVDILEGLREDIRIRLEDPDNDPRAQGRLYGYLGAVDAAVQLLETTDATVVQVKQDLLVALGRASVSAGQRPGRLRREAEAIMKRGLERLQGARTQSEALRALEEEKSRLETAAASSQGGLLDMAYTYAAVEALRDTHEALMSGSTSLLAAREGIANIQDSLNALGR